MEEPATTSKLKTVSESYDVEKELVKVMINNTNYKYQYFKVESYEKWNNRQSPFRQYKTSIGSEFEHLERKLLWHATTIKRLDNIWKHGLLPPSQHDQKWDKPAHLKGSDFDNKVIKSNKGSDNDQGIHLFNMAQYAWHHSRPCLDENENKAVLLLCEVAVGKPMVVDYQTMIDSKAKAYRLERHDYEPSDLLVGGQQYDSIMFEGEYYPIDSCKVVMSNIVTDVGSTVRRPEDNSLLKKNIKYPFCDEFIILNPRQISVKFVVICKVKSTFRHKVDAKGKCRCYAKLGFDDDQDDEIEEENDQNMTVDSSQQMNVD